ncbi:MAG: PaaI family thioesterase [candidate division Zixibacteria bacterium]|nr:PaaI family thioesterase [candidate division Zixibacteria bacterium]
MKVTVEQLQDIIREVPFASLLGIRILEVGKGSCRAVLPYDPRLLQYYGLVHGGVIASVADTMVYMAQATLNGITHNTVTTHLSVTYLGTAGQNDLYTEATILKNGRRLISGMAEITDTTGRQIAHVTATYMRLDAPVRQP